MTCIERPNEIYYDFDIDCGRVWTSGTDLPHSFTDPSRLNIEVAFAPETPIMEFSTCLGRARVPEPFSGHDGICTAVYLG